MTKRILAATAATLVSGLAAACSRRPSGPT